MTRLRMRLEKSVFILMIIVICMGMLFPACKAWAATNPYPWWNDKAHTIRSCTSYAWQMAYDRTGIALPGNLGDARTWYSNAKAQGYQVGATPVNDCIVVWDGGKWGHVAYVDGVDGSKIHILEAGASEIYGKPGIGSNWENGTVGSKRIYDSGKTLIGYIYLKNKPNSLPLIPSDLKEIHPATGDYIIRTAVGARYLDVAAQNTNAGANIQIYDPYDSPAQVFHINRNSMNTGYAVSNTKSGKFMDTAGNLPQPGLNVIQWDGNGVDGQQWRFWDAGDGYVYISNLYNYFVDVENGVNSNSTNVRVWEFNRSVAQKFKLIRVSGKSIRIDKGAYNILFAAGNCFLDVNGASKENTANIQIYKPNGSLAQIFTTDRNGANSAYYFYNPNSDKFLDTAGNIEGQQNVIQFQGNGAYGQQWVIEDAGGGLVYIRNLYGYYLDVVGGVNENGRNVQVYPFNGNPSQKWKLVKVSGKVKSTSLQPGSYMIQSKIGGKVLDISNNNFVINQMNGSSTQVFAANTMFDGYCFTSMDKNQYLDTSVAKDHGNAIPGTYTGNKTQNWFIEDAGGGYVYIRNLWGYYLHVQSGKNENGTNVNVWNFTGEDRQKWKLIRSSYTYTVSFNANGGQNYSSDSTVTADGSGSRFPSLNPFTRKGYHFTGWKVQKIHGQTTSWIIPDGSSWKWKQNASYEEAKLYVNTNRFLFSYYDIEEGDKIILWADWEKNPETPSEPENPTNPTNPTDTVQPSDPGTDPSVFLPEETVHEAIVSRESDSDLAGSKYGLLQLKGSKVKKKIIKLTWKKVPRASKYILYGNACGKKNKLKKITMTGKTAYTVKKLNGKKLKKGKYYKFLVIAVGQDNTVRSISKIVHTATTGGKVGNDKAIKTRTKKVRIRIRAGEPYNLKAKAIPASKKKKVKRHRGLSYEPSNPSIASVSSKGVIKGKKKGKCNIYVYAQNGISKKIIVTVN